MSDRIEVMDIVSIYWDDGEGSSLIDVTVLHVPCDVGDMWHFRGRKDVIHYVNPSCQTLHSIIKVEKSGS